jgi:hypothetical protein
MILGFSHPGVAVGESYGALVLYQRRCLGRSGYGRRGYFPGLLFEVLRLFLSREG